MFIIAATIALWHLGWVLALWNAPEPVMCVALAPYYRIVGSSRWLAVLLTFVSLLPILGRVRLREGFGYLACLIPQQALVMATAVSAIECILNSAYADGVKRPWHFIAIDQWGNVIPALAHTAYVTIVFAVALENWSKDRQAQRKLHQLL